MGLEIGLGATVALVAGLVFWWRRRSVRRRVVPASPQAQPRIGMQSNVAPKDYAVSNDGQYNQDHELNALVQEMNRNLANRTLKN